MQQIIAIGGGGFSRAESELKIERYILTQTKQVAPKICFLPQASNEDKDYIVRFFSAFTTLGAKPSWLSLFGKVKSGWQQQLLEQDVIYVGGGNTKSMLALWREWQVDQVLLEAYNRDVILAGVSAGAICWFEQALTDSVWPLGVIAGLGWLPGSCCPHYDGEAERRPTYTEKLKAGAIAPGIALEDDVAAHYVGGKLHRVVNSVAGKKAYQVSTQGHEVITVEEL